VCECVFVYLLRIYFISVIEGKKAARFVF
jgi:hypothetical protein